MNPPERRPEVRCRRLDPTDIAQPALRRVYEYWLSKKGERRAPARRDLDPADLRDVLPTTLLIDVTRDPWRFTYRLAGTLTERIHGVELTGRAIDTLKPPAFAAMLQNELIELAERVEPQFVYLEFINQMGVPRGYHVLRLPLAADGSTVDMVLVVSDYGADSKGLQQFLKTIKAQ
jgi:hypothetical protein